MEIFKTGVLVCNPHSWRQLLLLCSPPSRTVNSARSWVHAGQLITVLVIFRADDEALRAFSIPSFIFVPTLERVRKVLLSLFSSQETEGAGYCGVSAGNPGERGGAIPGRQSSLHEWCPAAPSSSSGIWFVLVLP